MRPMSPVVPGRLLMETIYAKDQPPYKPLPTVRHSDGTVVSRWHMSWPERLRAFITGDIYLHQMTFNQPLQPVKLEAGKVEV